MSEDGMDRPQYTTIGEYVLSLPDWQTKYLAEFVRRWDSRSGRHFKFKPNKRRLSEPLSNFDKPCIA